MEKFAEGNKTKGPETCDLAFAAVAAFVEKIKPRRQAYLARSLTPGQTRWSQIHSLISHPAEPVGRPLWGEAMEAAIEEFEEEHPGLYINGQGVLAAASEKGEKVKAEQQPLVRKRKYQTKCRVCSDSPRYMKQPRE